MDALGLSVLGVLIALPFFYFSWEKLFPPFGSTKSRNQKQAPRPSGRWPVIGHLPKLAASKELPFRLLANLADQYGPIFTLYLGVHQTVVISSWELAKECFTKNDRLLAARPPLAFGKYMASNQAFGMAPDGPYWRDIRKLVTHELLSNRQVELLKDIRTAEVDLSIEDLYMQWIGNSKLPIKVDMKKWFGDLSFNNITMHLAGKRYFGANLIGDEKTVGKYREMINRFFYLGGLFVVSDAIPWLEWLDLGGHIKEMKRVGKGLHQFMSSWLEEHRQWRAANPGYPSRDFIDIMLASLKKPEFAEYDSDIVVITTLLSLIIGGIDTTAITLTWAIAHMFKNPPILKKAQNELDGLIGNDRVATESDIKHLPYLQAIIKETLRLYPPGPLGAPHMTVEDCEIGGYHVSSGTRLMVNLWKLHRDPRVWEDPSEFRPERFLAGEGRDMDFRGLNFEFIPFGSGRRICPGSAFAGQVMHLTLARLLHGFDLLAEDGTQVDMSEGFGLALDKVTPLQVMLTPRLPLGS